jgi:DNA-binding transcriptional ArsR family regulator
MGAAARGPMHSSWAAVLTDPVRLAILQGLCELGEASASELRAHAHTSEGATRRHLEALEALGLVAERPAERDGLTPGRPGRRFVLDVEAAERVSELLAIIRRPLVGAAEAEPPPPRSRGGGGRGQLSG